MQSSRPLERSAVERPQAAGAGTRIRAWLEQASERLLPRIRRRLLATGLAQGGNLDEEARDALHEVVIEALRSEHRYDPSRGLAFWIHGIAMKVVLRRVERFGKAKRHLPAEGRSDDEVVETLYERLLDTIPDRRNQGPEEAVAARQELAAVLSTLPESHREVLRLYLEHDFDNEAVADALGIRPGTARVRIFRALRDARKGGAR